MRNFIFLFFLVFLLNIFLSNCKQPGPSGKESPKAKYSLDSASAAWQTTEGDKFRFNYPGTWIVKTKELAGKNNFFGLTEKAAIDIKNFYVLEIYEMQTMGRPFREFKFASVDLIDKRFGGEGTVRNTEDFKFKGMDARKYEADIPGKDGSFPVEVYAINGFSRYYVLFYTKFEKTDSIVDSIMKSIILFK